MIKTVAIVSLSSGILGESFTQHEVEIGLRRLEAYGLDVHFMPHALCGLDYIKNHPEKRAEDLLQAFQNPDVDMILCAIGGDDTYRLLPYLFEHDELKKAVRNKVFLGFSDTTINHMMLNSVGLPTFYGQAFLPDICELGTEMLPYTKHYFEELIRTGTIRQIVPSNVWYESRKSFDADQVGVPLIQHPNTGWELLQGSPDFSGKILGGCIDSIYDIFTEERYADMPELCHRYGVFPAAEQWQGRILLLESSEEKMPPEKYRKTLLTLKERGIFSAVNGILVGKPMDDTCAADYKKQLQEIVPSDLPVLCNLSIGHALPRCIIPFGVEARVYGKEQRIVFE